MRSSWSWSCIASKLIYRRKDLPTKFASITKGACATACAKRRRSSSTASSTTGRSNTKHCCAKSKLLQKSHIVLDEQADVVDAVLSHRDALDAEAERPAGVDFRI